MGLSLPGSTLLLQRSNDQSWFVAASSPQSASVTAEAALRRQAAWRGASGPPNLAAEGRAIGRSPALSPATSLQSRHRIKMGQPDRHFASLGLSRAATVDPLNPILPCSPGDDHECAIRQWPLQRQRLGGRRG